MSSTPLVPACTETLTHMRACRRSGATENRASSVSGVVSRRIQTTLSYLAAHKRRSNQPLRCVYYRRKCQALIPFAAFAPSLRRPLKPGLTDSRRAALVE